MDQEVVGALLFAYGLFALLLLTWLLVDVRQRGRSRIQWGLLWIAFGPVAAIAWLIRRRHSPVVDRAGWHERFQQLGVAFVVLMVSTSLTLLNTTACAVARVEGRAMLPTLRDQDRLLVNKLVYWFVDPHPGEIVMLRYPLDPNKSFVKRIVAEGGDRVQVSGGRVYRNGVLIDDSFIPPENRGGGDWGPRKVPPAHYFVMGDNRNNSSDSRHWGYVPRGYIIGRLWLRWYPDITRIDRIRPGRDASTNDARTN